LKYYSSEAIILRIKDLGESDLLVLFFTRDAGLLKGVAKAGRRSRRRFVNCLDHFRYSYLEYHQKGERQSFLIDSCKLIQGFEQLHSEYRLLAHASYFAELTETLFPINIPAEQMFVHLLHCFELLCKGESPEGVRLRFEGRAMALGGYAIATEKCCYCGRTYRGEGRAVFVPEKGAIACLGCARESKMCPGMDPESVKALVEIQAPRKISTPQLSLTAKASEELKRVLDQHVLYQLGKRLKSRKYIE